MCSQADEAVKMPSVGHRGTAPLLVRSGVSGLQVTYTADEKVLFQELVSIMRRCVLLAQFLNILLPLNDHSFTQTLSFLK